MRGAVLCHCLCSLPQWQEADSFLWEGNTSPRQSQWGPWVFPLATGIARRHGQPPLLGHPQRPTHTPSPEVAEAGGAGVAPRGGGGRPQPPSAHAAALGLLHKGQTLTHPGTG